MVRDQLFPAGRTGVRTATDAHSRGRREAGPCARHASSSGMTRNGWRGRHGAARDPQDHGADRQALPLDGLCATVAATPMANRMPLKAPVDAASTGFWPTASKSAQVRAQWCRAAGDGWQARRRELRGPPLPGDIPRTRGLRSQSASSPKWRARELPMSRRVKVASPALVSTKAPPVVAKEEPALISLLPTIGPIEVVRSYVANDALTLSSISSPHSDPEADCSMQTDWKRLVLGR